ncbi:hypothetical protein EB796_000967 [Bugula neritina]|uniref:Uncharacterized protein n=1 Tax=Bugula neritina TaxID=10212 RepID=A0A7J7KRE2_BUGNE|nr:hypothetical protein EB796_000967 [Bugula neritina]
MYIICCIPGQRQRPPAAKPFSNHISTKPVVPLSQSLDPPAARPPKSQISPPKPSTPEQETYEIVDSGEPSPMNPPAPPPKLGEPVPRVGRHGPLPLPPGADDDSGGSISPGQKPPLSTPSHSITVKPVKTPAPALHHPSRRKSWLPTATMIIVCQMMIRRYKHCLSCLNPGLPLRQPHRQRSQLSMLVHCQSSLLLQQQLQ